MKRREGEASQGRERWYGHTSGCYRKSPERLSAVRLGMLLPISPPREKTWGLLAHLPGQKQREGGGEVKIACFKEM